MEKMEEIEEVFIADVMQSAANAVCDIPYSQTHLIAKVMTEADKEKAIAIANDVLALTQKD